MGNREKHSATTLIHVIAKTRKITEFGTTVAARGEPPQRIPVFIKSTVDLINRTSCFCLLDMWLSKYMPHSGHGTPTSCEDRNDVCVGSLL